jgi:hypothetical protein
MAEPHRERILQALQTLGQGMVGTRHWGGTYLYAPIVERIWKQPEQVTQRPHAILREMPGSEFSATTGVSRGAPGTVGYRDRFAVQLFGYVEGNDEITPSQWMQRFWWDWIVTLKGNRQLGGEANEIEFGPMEPFDVLVNGQPQPYQAGFEQPLVIIVDPVVVTVG